MGFCGRTDTHRHTYKHRTNHTDKHGTDHTQRNAVEIHYQKIIYALCSPIPGAARTRPKDALTSTM